MLSKLLKAILDVVLYIPQEQRAVLAHVLQVSNACPDQFVSEVKYDATEWNSFTLGVSFCNSKRRVTLNGVHYPLNRRAAAILNKNFYQLHLMKHHQKVGKKITALDAGMQEEKAVAPTQNVVNLADWVGKSVAVRMENRAIIGGDVQVDDLHQTYRIGIHRNFSGGGKYLGERSVLTNITHISDKIPESSPHEASSWELEYTGNGMAQRVVEKPIQPMPETKPTTSLENLRGKKVRIRMRSGRIFTGAVHFVGYLEGGFSTYKIGTHKGVFFNDGLFADMEREDYISTIDDLEPTLEIKKEPEWVTSFNLLDCVGKTIEVKCRDSDFNQTCAVEKYVRDSDYDVLVHGRSYMSNGSYYNDQHGSVSDIREIRLVD